MCNFEKGFVLCTCADSIDSTKPYWVLSRQKKTYAAKFDEFIVGETMLDFCFNRDLREQILNQLRERNCFDQEFCHTLYDRLDIFDGIEIFSYEFSSSGWRIYEPNVPADEHIEKCKGKVSYT